MVRRALRSTSLRNIQIKTPAGKNKIHYKRQRPNQASCAGCHGKLSGIPRLRPAKIGKLSKTKHKPNRPFGGSLCSSCARNQIKAQVLGL